MIFLRDLSCFFNVDALCGMLVQRYGQKKSGGSTLPPPSCFCEFYVLFCPFAGISCEFFLIFSEFLRVFCEFLVLKSQQLQYSEHCFTICFFLNRSGMTGRVGCNEWTSWRRQRNVLTRTRVHPSQDDGSCWTKQRNVLPESAGHPRPDKGLPWPSGGAENGKWFILPRFPCGR